MFTNSANLGNMRWMMIHDMILDADHRALTAEITLEGVSEEKIPESSCKTQKWDPEKVPMIRETFLYHINDRGKNIDETVRYIQ